MAPVTQSGAPTFGEAARVWSRIGVLSFGGPAAQIALMHREIVEERGWLTEKRFLDALGFCMLLPGPEAMQLATFAGWRLHGVAGGMAAGLLFVVPGAVMMAALAILYAFTGSVPLAGALFLGIKAAVVAIVIEAMVRVARRALDEPAHWIIAGLAFLAIFAFSLPFPLIVAAAAAAGYAFLQRRDDSAPPPPGRRDGLASSAATVGLWLAIWWVPLLILAVIPGAGLLFALGLFFSKLAVVTFGGAYAVLAYMAQDAVETHNWLAAGEMLDGLGLAETTMGPLILVTEFVGFLTAFKQGGLWWGLAGAAVTLWATFAPCFLWIFAGAPYIDRIGSQPRLRGALSAITVAVVGVIANLALWFAIHVFFAQVSDLAAGPLLMPVPDPASIDWRVVVMFAVCAFALLRLHLGIVTVLVLAAVMGAATMLI